MKIWNIIRPKGKVDWKEIVEDVSGPTEVYRTKAEEEARTQIAIGRARARESYQQQLQMLIMLHMLML